MPAVTKRPHRANRLGCQLKRALTQIARVQRRRLPRRMPMPEGNQRQTGQSCKTPPRWSFDARSNGSRESRSEPRTETSSRSTWQRKPQNNIPMVPAPLLIALIWSSVTTQASAVSTRSATHAGAASRSESGTRSGGASAFTSNVVFDFGEKCVRVCVLELETA
jgi:hypothetical protein